MTTEQPPRRRVVVVEYDVTRLGPEQVDALLFAALASGQDVSFKIEITPGVGLHSLADSCRIADRE